MGRAWLLLALLCTALGAQSAYYEQNWCGHGAVEWLYDGKCQKVFPSNTGRDFVCGVQHDRVLPGYSPETSLNNVSVDTTTLQRFAIPRLNDVNLALVMVQRVAGKLYYRYLSNGNHNVPGQTWSSSKIFCEANGASKMQEQCGVSLSSQVEGKHGWTQFGDLATVIDSYDTTMGYTSNSLALYFCQLGGHERLNALVQDWLGRGPGEQLGGSYGEPAPADLQFNIDGVCEMEPDMNNVYADMISPLTAVELLRRFVLHREVGPAFRWPGLSYDSVKHILYGAADRSFFGPNFVYGGMSSDIQILIQSGIANMTELDTRSKGRWRILSKLGAGIHTTTDGTNLSQFVSNNYACLPDGSGAGAEFVLHVWSSTAYGTADPDVTVQALVQPIVATIIKLIETKQIQ